ncbi:hypothetical protein K435DRAFT_781767 [Dendrothele bispora CBS 962.96]|uniref:Uncharacterized protein n=1 Tax=Dendrothele bispora (strain CBS 962.96) TaxID=1314807 RepID=A0A4S8LIU2_DENBC|nr:hypothetical protein K435DRAFT_781767 [Dendrothele bispora CBS 962.96]
MMAPVLDTGLSSYRPTTPFSAPSRVSSPGYTDPWAERAIAKTTATALGKEVFSDRNSAAYSIYGGVAVGSPSQVSTPIPIPEQPIEPLIDIFSDEPTTSSSSNGIYNSQAGPGTLTRAKSNASALDKEVFQRFGTGQATPRSDTQNFW